MGSLTPLAVAIGIIAVPVSANPSVEQWQPLIAEASARFGVPESWITKVMHAESRGSPFAVSRKGAVGLMQIMPGTWDEMRAALGLGADPYEPRANILTGTFYLKLMYERFGYPGLFAAYNAGPSRYSDHLTGKRRLPIETRSYVAELAGGGAKASQILAVRPRPSLFFPISAALQTGQ